MDQPTCKTCRWWWLYGEPADEDRKGECRRNAPLPVIDDGKHNQALWPSTDNGDWCGEHKPAPS
jgi:hypothetical protein